MLVILLLLLILLRLLLLMTTAIAATISSSTADTTSHAGTATTTPLPFRGKSNLTTSNNLRVKFLINRGKDLIVNYLFRLAYPPL